MCAKTVIRLSRGSDGLVMIAEELGVPVTGSMRAAWGKVQEKKDAAAARAVTEESKRKVHAANKAGLERRAAGNAQFQLDKKVGLTPSGGGYKSIALKMIVPLGDIVTKVRKKRRSQAELVTAFESGDASVRKCGKEECLKIHTAKSPYCGACTRACKATSQGE
jgi:hypothetical protein